MREKELSINSISTININQKNTTMSTAELKAHFIKMNTKRLINVIAKGGMNVKAATIAATLLEKRIG